MSESLTDKKTNSSVGKTPEVTPVKNTGVGLKKVTKPIFIY